MKVRRRPGSRARPVLTPPRSQDTRDRSLWLTSGMLLLAGVLFFAIAEDVVSNDPLVLLDASLADWFHHHGAKELTDFFTVVSILHGIVAICAYGTVCALILVREGNQRWLLGLALIIPAGMGLNALLKLAYARARPMFDDPWVTLASYSFPSGHTSAAVLFYGFLASCFLPRIADRRVRVLCMVFCGLMVVLVALSRMYLGAHFLSDVLAAACASGAWVALCLIIIHRVAP